MIDGNRHEVVAARPPAAASDCSRAGCDSRCGMTLSDDTLLLHQRLPMP